MVTRPSWWQRGWPLGSSSSVAAGRPPRVLYRETSLSPAAWARGGFMKRNGGGGGAAARVSPGGDRRGSGARRSRVRLEVRVGARRRLALGDADVADEGAGRAVAGAGHLRELARGDGRDDEGHEAEDEARRRDGQRQLDLLVLLVLVVAVVREDRVEGADVDVLADGGGRRDVGGQRGDRRLERLEARVGRHLGLDLAEGVLVVGAALGRDDVVPLARALVRRGLEGPLFFPRRERHGLEGPAPDVADLLGRLLEVVVAEEGLAVVGEDVLDEGLEERALGARGRLVRADVEVGHGDDGPRVLAGHVVERHLAEVRRRVAGHDAEGQRLLRGGLDAAARDRLRRRLVRTVEVLELDLGEAVVVAVAAVDVADGVGRARDHRRHLAGALDGDGGRGPVDRRADLRPLLRARGREVLRDALGRRRAVGAVVDDDGFAGGGVEVRVEDVRDDARVEVQARRRQRRVGHVVEEGHGAEVEGGVEGRDARGLEIVVVLGRERHVAGPKVVEGGEALVLAHELELARAGTDGAVGHLDAGLGAGLEEAHDFPVELRGVRRAGTVELDGVGRHRPRGSGEGGGGGEGELHGFFLVVAFGFS